MSVSNTFLTVQEIAREALLRLRNNLVARQLVYNDYSNDFAQKGDTIQVKKPATFSASSFTGSISAQNITESNVLVSLDSIADVSVEVTSKEMTLNIDQFGSQVLDGAMQALAQKIDSDILSTVYMDIPYFNGTSGTTPDAMDDFALAAKILNDNKAPLQGRVGIWDTAALAKFQQISNLFKVNESGDNMALREGQIGRIIGIDNYMSQNVKTHTAGGFTSLADVTVSAATTAGDLTIKLTSGAGAATTKLEKGDLLTIDGKTYTVTAQTAAAVAGVIATVKIYPAVSGDLNGKAVTFADRTARAHTANLVFHKNAFAFVNRPLMLPQGGATGYVANFEGLSIRVTFGYDMSSKTQLISFDTLYGIKTLYPELAVRAIG